MRVEGAAQALPWLATAYRHCIPQRLRARVSRYRAKKRYAFLNFAHSPAPKNKQRTSPRARARAKRPDGDGAPSAGVNIITYAYGQFGLADAARLYVRALLSVGWKIAVRDPKLQLPHECNDKSLRPYIKETSPYDINIIFVNPDQFDETMHNLGTDAWCGRRNIACWYWELERFPEAWLPALELMDEVIVASTFVAESLRAVTGKRVTVVPPPLHDLPISDRSRIDFGIGEDFTFLTSFDFNSSYTRKSPISLIEAFSKAFPERDIAVRLLIKSSNGYRHPNDLERVLRAASRDSRIRLRDEILERADMNALMNCADAYVSLHRSEGYGLAMAEAMWMGKPVVATAYSGNMDFMDSSTAYLVDFTRVAVRDGQYLHGEGQYWAEPDIAMAARHMRHLYEQPAERARIAAAGHKAIRAACSAEACGRALTCLLREPPPVTRGSATTQGRETGVNGQ